MLRVCPNVCAWAQLQEDGSYYGRLCAAACLAHAVLDTWPNHVLISEHQLVPAIRKHLR